MRSRRTRNLDEIAHIRALQRQAEEIRLSQASAGLDDRLRQQKTEERRQEARERSWTQTLDGRLDVILFSAWASAMTQGAQQLTRAAQAVTEARSHVRVAGEALRAAQARAEAAEVLEKRAIRRDRRMQERRSLLETSDLFTRRSLDAD